MLVDDPTNNIEKVVQFDVFISGEIKIECQPNHVITRAEIISLLEEKLLIEDTNLEEVYFNIIGEDEEV